MAPNPVVSGSTFSLSGLPLSDGMPYSITVTDLAGRHVASLPHVQAGQALAMPVLPQGPYLVMATAGAQVLRTRLVVR